MGVTRKGWDELYLRPGLLRRLWHNHTHRGIIGARYKGSDKQLNSSHDISQVFVMDDRTRTGGLGRRSGLASRFGESIPDYEETQVSCNITCSSELQ